MNWNVCLIFLFLWVNSKCHREAKKLGKCRLYKEKNYFYYTFMFRLSRRQLILWKYLEYIWYFKYQMETLVVSSNFRLLKSIRTRILQFWLIIFNISKFEPPYYIYLCMCIVSCMASEFSSSYFMWIITFYGFYNTYI